MKKHNCFDEACALVKNNIAVLLTGEKGCGKTTLAMQIAEELGLEFYGLSMTRQTTLSNLLGFKNINGEYSPTMLYDAATKGGMFLLDEIDASDPNVILSLNTIENGYISFPSGIVKLHKDFRLIATSNPQDGHSEYVGRSKLDAATLDRFDQIELTLDSSLEKSLVSADVYARIKIIRELLVEVNATKKVSMRDSQRYQKRRDLKLEKNFVERLFGEHYYLLEKYEEAVENLPAFQDQKDCSTLEELMSVIKAEKSEI